MVSIMKLNAKMLIYFHSSDYSENMSQKNKYEPQSAHFNRKSYSLHCMVKYMKEKEFDYIFHLSDDLVHDASHTSAARRHQLTCQELPKIIREKSDNCSKQARFSAIVQQWLLSTTEQYYCTSPSKGMVRAYGMHQVLLVWSLLWVMQFWKKTSSTIVLWTFALSWRTDFRQNLIATTLSWSRMTSSSFVRRKHQFPLTVVEASTWLLSILTSAL